MLLVKSSRDALLNPLQTVTGVVERRHTLPILSNVLIETSVEGLTFTATDLEVQIRTTVIMSGASTGTAITVSARKLQDILRSLGDDSVVALDAKDNRLTVQAGKSRFQLQTLPAADFPRLATGAEELSRFSVSQKLFRGLLEKVQFAMAQQDIRYYLNGMLLSVEGRTLRAVATDGHRLSYAAFTMEQEHEPAEVILPRKTVLELIRLLRDSDEPVEIVAKANQISFGFGSSELISKVIDGKFPDYTKVIPTSYEKRFKIERLALQQALQRAAILSNEKLRGVRLILTKDSLAVLCTNNEQEEAQEELALEYNGAPMDVGFNVSYLLDVLNHLATDSVECAFGDASSSMLTTIPSDSDFKYVVMPMRI